MRHHLRSIHLSPLPRCAGLEFVEALQERIAVGLIEKGFHRAHFRIAIRNHHIATYARSLGIRTDRRTIASIVLSMPGRKSLFAFALISLFPALHLHAACSPTVAVQVPATACKSGAATAAVIAVPGATYLWTVDGGQISGDAASDHVT